MKIYIYALLAICLMTGCLKEEKINTTVQISLDFPEEFKEMDKTQIEVTLSNITNGIQYKSRCAQNGVVTFNVEYGFYQASFQHKYIQEDIVHIFNGRVENIILSPQTQAASQNSFPMEIVRATSAQILINEFYFYGCIGNDGKNYTYDSYLSVYNNTGQVAYLDGICIGMVTPMTSNSPSKYTKPDGTLRDSLPLDQMVWQFPGSGQEYPIEAGRKCIIAVSAINHKALHPNSVDLSKADFAFWTEEVDMSSNMVQKPAIGVKYLTNIWRTKPNTKAFPVGITPKALILFRIEGQSAESYVANPKNITKVPPGSSSSGLDYLIVPKEWVTDGIECVTSIDKANKRLTTNVDAGFFFVPNGASGCGLGATRKVEEVVNGRVVYEDTNNSSLDLEAATPSLKNN